MSNPPAFGDPDRMTSANYFLGAGDNGGRAPEQRHQQQGRVFDGRGRHFQRAGRSRTRIDKTAKIYYEAQTHLLTSGADYNDLYNALFQACNNLAGTNGHLRRRLPRGAKGDAGVEMNLQPVANFNLDAPVCPAGPGALVRVLRRSRVGIGNFSFITGAGTNGVGYDSSPSVCSRTPVGTPVSRLILLHGYGFIDRDGAVSCCRATRISISPMPLGSRIRISTPGCRVQHERRHDMERCRHAVRQRRLQRHVARGSDNPLLAGRRLSAIVMVHIQPGQSRVIGRTNVRFRWRMGSTPVQRQGLVARRHPIYSCAAALPGVPANPNPANTATAVPTNSSLTWTAAGATSYDVRLDP
jgi:hypothetical protein